MIYSNHKNKFFKLQLFIYSKHKIFIKEHLYILFKKLKILIIIYFIIICFVTVAILAQAAQVISILQSYQNATGQT